MFRGVRLPPPEYLALIVSKMSDKGTLPAFLNSYFPSPFDTETKHLHILSNYNCCLAAFTLFLSSSTETIPISVNKTTLPACLARPTGWISKLNPSRDVGKPSHHPLPFLGRSFDQCAAAINESMSHPAQANAQSLLHKAWSSSQV